MTTTKCLESNNNENDDNHGGNNNGDSNNDEYILHQHTEQQQQSNSTVIDEISLIKSESKALDKKGFKIPLNNDSGTNNILHDTYNNNIEVKREGIDNGSCCIQNGKNAAKRMSFCANCNLQIIDRFIMHVYPDLEFHADCLVCFCCDRSLSQSDCAFVRGGKTYCRNDYLKEFGKRCARCREHLGPQDMVMRARSLLYHINCFSCLYCERQLSPGENFLLKNDEIFCRIECFRLSLNSFKPTNNNGANYYSNGSENSNFFPSNNNFGMPPHQQQSQPPLWLSPQATTMLLPPNPPQQHQRPQQQPEIDNTPTTISSQLNHSGLDVVINSATVGPCTSTSPPSHPHQSSSTPNSTAEFCGQNMFPDYYNGGGVEATIHGRTHSSLSSSSSANSPFSNADSVAAPSSTNSGCGGTMSSMAACSVGMTNSAGSSSTTSGGAGGNVTTTRKSKKDKPLKAQRVRTVLNDGQLKILKHMYATNQRPDTSIKDQLVEMTGLSSRVIRVWFQNKRCKDKKRQNAAKKDQEEMEKEQALHGVLLNGIGPLVAGSPTPLCSNGGSADAASMCGDAEMPVDIRQFPQNVSSWGLPEENQPLPPPPYHHHHHHHHHHNHHLQMPSQQQQHLLSQQQQQPVMSSSMLTGNNDDDGRSAMTLPFTATTSFGETERSREGISPI